LVKQKKRNIGEKTTLKGKRNLTSKYQDDKERCSLHEEEKISWWRGGGGKGVGSKPVKPWKAGCLTMIHREEPLKAGKKMVDEKNQNPKRKKNPLQVWITRAEACVPRGGDSFFMTPLAWSLKGGLGEVAVLLTLPIGKANIKDVNHWQRDPKSL